MLNLSMDTPKDLLFSQSNVLSIYGINKMQIGIFMYKLCNNLLPVDFKIAYTLNCEVHSYNTRSSAMFHLPKPRIDKFKFSISFAGPCLWNNLLDKVNLAHSLVAVKCLFKEYCMNHECNLSTTFLFCFLMFFYIVM